MQGLTPEDLSRILRRIDGRGYKAYKDIAGSYRFPGWTLAIDHVQGDPFASPSKIRLRVEKSKANVPPELFENPVRRMALQDFLARRVGCAIENLPGGRRGSGKSGLVMIDAGAQEVLERTALVVTRDWVEARLQVGLPAAGRSVLGKQAEAMLCGDLPKIVDQALCWKHLPESIQNKGRAFVECVENHEHIRHELDEGGSLRSWPTGPFYLGKAAPWTGRYRGRRWPFARPRLDASRSSFPIRFRARKGLPAWESLVE